MADDDEYIFMEKSNLEKKEPAFKPGRLRGDMGDYEREKIRVKDHGYTVKPYDYEITQEKDNIITNQFRKYKFTYTPSDINFFNSLYTGLGIKAPFEDTSKEYIGARNVRVDMNEIYKFMEYATLAYKDILNDGSKLIKRHKFSDPKIHYGRASYGAVVRVWRVKRDDLKFWTDNNGNDALILGFRGSDDFKDVMDDLSDEPISLDEAGWIGINDTTNGFAHYGFIQQLESIYDDVLKEVNLNPDINIYACGHSLGSSLGVMALYRLYLEGKANNVRYNIKGFFGFGSPKGLYCHNTRIDNLFNIINIFHEKDVVSYLAPLYYDHLGTKLILSDDNTFKLIYATQLTPYLPVNLEFTTDIYNQLIHKMKPTLRHQDGERRIKNLWYLALTLPSETQKNQLKRQTTLNYDLLQYSSALIYYVGFSLRLYHGTANYLSLLNKFLPLGIISEGNNIINVQPFTPMRFIDTLEDKIRTFDILENLSDDDLIMHSQKKESSIKKKETLIKKNIVNISNISQISDIPDIIGFMPITYNLNNKFIIF